jgi:ribosomal protein L11 methyltransferase
MAAAKTWPRPVWASDIDREAVAIARDNARRNGLGRRIRLATGPGLHAAALRAASPFDLVLANILARPLIGLAPILRCRVAADGWLVLSGLLIEQTAWVEAAYRRQGFVPARRFTFEDWRTLVLGRRSRKKQSAGPRAGARWRSPDGART